MVINMNEFDMSIEGYELHRSTFSKLNAEDVDKLREFSYEVNLPDKCWVKTLNKYIKNDCSILYLEGKGEVIGDEVERHSVADLDESDD